MIHVCLIKKQTRFGLSRRPSRAREDGDDQGVFMPAHTSTSNRAAPGVGSDRDHRRRWWILAVLGIAQLMVVLDASVVNIALPSAQKALHFSNDSRQWIITAYALAFGRLLLLGGRVRGPFGRKGQVVRGAIGAA